MGEVSTVYSDDVAIKTSVGKIPLMDSGTLIGKKVECIDKWSKEIGMILFTDGCIFIGLA